MGNTCRTDLYAAKQDGILGIADPNQIKNRDKYREPKLRVKFPQLTSHAQSRIDQLNQLNYQEQEKNDKVTKQHRKQPEKLNNGWIYKGQWHDGKPWGKGKYYTPNNCLIECYSIDGRPVGDVRLVQENGDFYQGKVKQFKAHGSGILYHNNIKYQGEFRQNYLEGQGREESESYIYEGTFEKGYKSYGKLLWNIGKENQTIYEGRFQDEKFHGRGTLQNNLGTFKGIFRAGKKFGDGIFTWKNGSRFEGQYVNDKKNGPGMMFNPKGLMILKTNWENDKPVIVNPLP